MSNNYFNDNGIKIKITALLFVGIFGAIVIDTSAKIVAEIKKPDLNVYTRIRKALKGKAIVTIQRSACSGCHNIVPSQRQIELRQNRRLFTCESCGRILVSAEIAEEAAKSLS